MRTFPVRWRSAASRFGCETGMARGVRRVILGLLCASLTACETALPEPRLRGRAALPPALLRLSSPVSSRPAYTRDVAVHAGAYGHGVCAPRSPAFIRNRAPRPLRLPERPRPAPGRLRTGGALDLGECFYPSRRAASISSGSLGIAPVSTSWPSAVTRTSSSMRTPIPW